MIHKEVLFIWAVKLTMIIGNTDLTGNAIRIRMTFGFNNILSTYCHFKGLYKVFVKCDYPTFCDANARQY
jgi:hypothetical protein